LACPGSIAAGWLLLFGLIQKVIKKIKSEKALARPVGS